MSFEEIPTVEDAQFYLDLAFRRAKKTANSRRTSINDPKEEKSRKIELSRVATVKDVLGNKFFGLVEGFPSLDQLTPFYKEMVKLTTHHIEVKKALSTVQWVGKKVNKLGSEYQQKIDNAESITDMQRFRKEFYGRISSVVEEAERALSILQDARKQFVKFPTIKQMPTICITGFPNVGKTTLLKKLTGSSPEIKDYAFTTKRLNLGYEEIEGTEYQFIDTPGTLSRKGNMNEIEQMSFLAMRYAAGSIIYVWDVTEPFSLEDQERLCERITRMGKPVIEYASKTDIANEEKIVELSKARGRLVTNLEELKERIVEVDSIN